MAYDNANNSFKKNNKFGKDNNSFSKKSSNYNPNKKNYFKDKDADEEDLGHRSHSPYQKKKNANKEFDDLVASLQSPKQAARNRRENNKKHKQRKNGWD